MKPFKLEVYFETGGGHQMREELKQLKDASQIELAFLGATTPSCTMVEEARTLLPDTFINVMINPGSPVKTYSPRDQRELSRQIKGRIASGADGIVVGALTPTGTLDLGAMQRFADAAKGKPLTMHSAFDKISPAHWPETIAALASAGVSTIMSAGGKDGRIGTHIGQLQQLQRMAAPYGIAIMARGGIEVAHFADAVLAPQIMALAEDNAPAPGVHARFNTLGSDKRPDIDGYMEAASYLNANGLYIPRTKPLAAPVAT